MPSVTDRPVLGTHLTSVIAETARNNASVKSRLRLGVADPQSISPHINPLVMLRQCPWALPRLKCLRENEVRIMDRDEVQLRD